jgi:hypothetical protein
MRDFMFCAFLLATAVDWLVSDRCPAATLFYESAVLGPTGVTIDELYAGVVPGGGVHRNLYIGDRFELTSRSLITAVGGHFVGEGATPSTIFGAIVRLGGPLDLPDDTDLMPPHLLGTTNLVLPEKSEEVIGSMMVTADPGWYAVIFGSGAFGADGAGALIGNNTDLGTPSRLERQPIIEGTGWGNLSPLFKNYRVIVRGEVVPEPSALSLVAVACIMSCMVVSLGAMGEQPEWRF